MARVLLRFGADLDLVNSVGNTALHVAHAFRTLAGGRVREGWVGGGGGGRGGGGEWGTVTARGWHLTGPSS